MEYIYLGAILMLRVVQSICSKSNSNLMPEERSAVTAYISMRLGISAVVAFALFIISDNIISSVGNMPPLGWLLAGLTGVSLTVSTVCGLNAMKGASIALCALFASAGLLIPTVGGVFLYGQSVSLWQGIGIFLMIAAAIMLGLSSGQTNGKLTAKTFLLLIGNMLGNGCTMLFQTMYKEYIPSGSVLLYSCLQFLFPSAVLLIFAEAQRFTAKLAVNKFSKKLMFYTVLAAAAVFGVSQISTVASSVIPVAVLFPISDGGHTVISAVIAATVFKERFTVKSAVGVLFGVCGMVMIKLLG